MNVFFSLLFFGYRCQFQLMLKILLELSQGRYFYDAAMSCNNSSAEIWDDRFSDITFEYL